MLQPSDFVRQRLWKEPSQREYHLLRRQSLVHQGYEIVFLEKEGAGMPASRNIITNQQSFMGRELCLGNELKFSKVLSRNPENIKDN